MSAPIYLNDLGVVCALGGRLRLSVLRETVQGTTKITAMVMFILICAQPFGLCVLTESCAWYIPAIHAQYRPSA